MTGFILLSAPRRKDTALLSLFNALVGTWCLFQLLGELSDNRDLVLLFTKINLAAAVLIPVAFFSFARAFSKSGRFSKVWINAGCAASFMLILTLKGSLFISGLETTRYFKYYPSAGPLYFVFAAYFFIYVFAGFYELIKALSESNGVKRNQTAYILAASLIGFGCGSTQFFPVFGINIFPAGMFIFPLYAVLAAYAVVFHRLLDIKIAIRKSLIYSIIVIVFSAVYALMVLMFMGMMQKITGLNYYVSAAATIAVFALLFDPLKSYVQKTVDRLFFRDSYDAQKALNDFSKAAVSIISLDQLFDAALSALCVKWKIKDVIIAVKDHKESRFAVRRRKGFEQTPDRTSPPLVVPIKDNDNISGFLALGEKPMRGMWNGQDMEILEVICGQIGVALEKERLYSENLDAQRKLMQNEKYAAIGSISASMAHEIKNPLTALKGMVSVLAENASDKEFMENFSNISIRQLDRINTTVENLLRLGRRPDEMIPGQETALTVDLGEVLDEILSLISAKCKTAGIIIKKNMQNAPKVAGRKKELLHALNNVIMNAIEAMHEGGELEIITGPGQVSIKDTGQGMNAEALSRMFDPFYTTKEKGAGIGLSITDDIISRSGGKIEVESIYGKGTVFKIRFK